MGVPAIVMGNRHGPFRSVMSPEFVRSYADATADPNPAYREAAAVPPVALVTQIFEAQAAGNADIPRELMASMRSGVHGEHDLMLHRPLEPGEELRTWVEGHGGSVAGSNTRVTIHFQTLDSGGEAVAEQWWTTVLIGTDVADAVGSPAPDHAFPEQARSRPAASVRLSIDEDMARRYAEVSGDWSAHHFDLEAATKAGASGLFVHGLCTMGLCARAVVEGVAGGDPRRVRRVAVRFAKPALLGEDLEVELYDAGGGAYPFEATAGQDTVIRNGLAELFPG